VSRVDVEERVYQLPRAPGEGTFPMLGWRLTFRPGWLARICGCRPLVADVYATDGRTPDGRHSGFRHVSTGAPAPDRWLKYIHLRQLPAAPPDPELVEAHREVAQLCGPNLKVVQ
jgi:hypothetical protein